MDEFFESAERINRDILATIKDGSLALTRADIRYFVDAYYEIQEFRKRASNQKRDKKKAGESHFFTDWIFNQQSLIESEISKVLNAWTETDPVSKWAKDEVLGIAHTLAAGLSAHIDIEIANTVGKVWRFAGLDPTVKWWGSDKAKAIVREVYGKASGRMSEADIVKKLDEVAELAGRNSASLLNQARWRTGKATLDSLAAAVAKRPWNARLKVLCWKIGDSFVKVSNSPKSAYGKFYRAYKGYQVQRNELGHFKEQADEALATKKWNKSTDAYKAYVQGKLPPGRLDLRARRYAVKLFLAHWHEVAHRHRFGKEPPMPYPIKHLGHTDWIKAADIKDPGVVEEHVRQIETAV